MADRAKHRIPLAGPFRSEGGRRGETRRARLLRTILSVLQRTVLPVLLAISVLGQTYALSQTVNVKGPAAAVRLVVNGLELAPDVPPEVVSGLVFVPIRAVAEVLGYEVAWDPGSGVATITTPGGHRRAAAEWPRMGSDPGLVVDGAKLDADPPPRLAAGRLMIPLRAVARALGWTVSWDAATRTVAIGHGGPFLEVHIIRAGQGQAILVELPNGENMLAGAGGEGEGQTVLSYLAAEGVTHLNWVVAIHPDAGHIGALSEVVRGVSLGKVVLSEALLAGGARAGRAGETLAQLMASVEALGLGVVAARPGLALVRGRDIKGEAEIAVTVLGPLPPGYPDPDEVSIVLKVSYGDVEFLLTGGIGPAAEAGLLRTWTSPVVVLRSRDGAGETIPQGHFPCGARVLRRGAPDVIVLRATPTSLTLVEPASPGELD